MRHFICLAIIISLITVIMVHIAHQSKYKSFGSEDTIHIFFIVDDNYVKYLSVAMASILKNTENPVYFHILDDNIAKKTKIKLLKLQNYKDFAIEFLPVHNIRPLNLPPSIMPHINKTTNYRLLLSSLTPEIKKCILSDADLVYVSDIKELWNIDVEDFYMAAVPDPADKNRTNNWIEKLPVNEKKHYVNTGVTVLNLEKWRQDNIESKFFTYATLYHQYLNYPDQDLLNIVLHSKVKYLNPKFNAMPEQIYYDLPEQISAFYNPVVIHWAGPSKPWENPDAHQPQYFWNYVNLSPFAAQIYADYYIPPIAAALKKYLECQIKRKKSPLYNKLCSLIP